METYSLLRELADSWALLGMFAVFIGIIFWAFRPGSKDWHADAANIPLRDDSKPAAARICAKSNGAADNG